MKSENVRAFYEADSQVYDLRWVKAGGKATAKAQMTVVESLTKSWRARDLLEIGCGSGRFSVYIADISPSVVYLDIAQGMLSVTRDKLKARSRNFVGLNASVYWLPLASCTRDAVISINVFNHIEKPAKALKEIHRVLRPGGKFLFNYSNLYSYFFPAAMMVNRRQRSIGRDVYSVWSKPKEVEILLREIGFSIQEVMGNVFVPLHLDKPGLRAIPLFLNRFSKKGALKWLSPTLFISCEKR